MSRGRRVPRMPRSASASADPRPRRAAIGIATVVSLLVVSALIGRSGGGDADTSSVAKTESLPADRADEGAADAGADAAAATGAADVDASATASGASEATDRAVASDLGGSAVEAKIVRTGSVSIEVEDRTFDASLGKLRALATGVGGFVSASETTQLGDDPQGSVTLRVPAKEFDRVLERIGDLGKVTSETTGSQDVTGEYTDVGSRIKALEAEREQIGLVLARAESIPDILSVRDRLTVVQTELEQLQGRKQVLDDQTALSTLTVSVAEQGGVLAEVEEVPERSALGRLWHDSTDRFGNGGRAIALGLATLAPWLLLGLVLWVPGRLAYRRLTTVPAPPATTAD